MLIRRRSQGFVSEEQYSVAQPWELRKAETDWKCGTRWDKATWSALEVMSEVRHWSQHWDTLIHL